MRPLRPFGLCAVGPLFLMIMIAIVSTRAEAQVADCDKAAASPFDPARPAQVTPVQFFDIDVQEAIKKCTMAFQAEPKNPRIIFELARALERSGRDSADRYFGLYKEAADDNYAIAIHSLAGLYSRGEAVVKDDTEALRLYMRAAELGVSLSMFAIAEARRSRAVTQSDFVEAATWYKRAAEAGFAPAMFRYGLTLEDGTGVTKNQEQALLWMRRAAEAGNADAMLALGVRLAQAQGIERNDADALAWFRRAAALGNAESMRWLGSMVQEGRGAQKSQTEANQWFRKAADLGDSEGMVLLAINLGNGLGIKKSISEALSLLKKATDLGNAKGARLQGILLEESLAKNPKGHTAALNNELERRTRELYLRAAEGGDENAMLLVGMMAQAGKGGSQDFPRAFDWYLRASDRGNGYATNNAGVMLTEGIGVPRDFEKARTFFKRAADLDVGLANDNIFFLDHLKQFGVFSGEGPDSKSCMRASFDAEKFIENESTDKESKRDNETIRKFDNTPHATFSHLFCFHFGLFKDADVGRSAIETLRVNDGDVFRSIYDRPLGINPELSIVCHCFLK